MSRLMQSVGYGLTIDLDGNVGSSGGNERSDVGIVQFALLMLRQKGGLLVPGSSIITVDGFFGTQTADYIAEYQKARVTLPGPGLGQLPPPNGNFGSIRKNASWTIGVLKQDVEKATFQNFIDLIRINRDSPPFLKSFFWI